MVTGLFAATGVCYAIACTLYLVFLVRDTDRMRRVAAWMLGAAAVAYVAFLAADFLIAGNMPLGNIQQTLSLASLLIVVAFLAALTSYRVAVLGGFITPVTLLFFLGAGLGRSVGNVPSDVREIFLPLHIGVNVLGVVAFALAFAAAVAYVIQERLLRQKKIGGLFQRLPALDALDSYSFRLLLIGFPLLTIGIVTGAIWAVRSPETQGMSAPHGFALLAWLVFAGVLLLRRAAGWQGRRAAVGTMLGFACAIAVLIGYVVRSGATG
jgi:ABC-type uncharacterized transport system permease subunit